MRAVAELVADAHPASISVPAVAARAGVGVATVYRYFPTKEALLDASALVALVLGEPGSSANTPFEKRSVS